MREPGGRGENTIRRRGGPAPRGASDRKRKIPLDDPTIRKIRELRGEHSQEWLANEVGLDHSTISRIERGEAEPTLSNLRSFARVFKIPVVDLLAEPAVPIVGYVGAGGQTHYGGEQQFLGSVPAVAGGVDNAVAVVVRGESMLGDVADGSILLYNDRRDPPGDALYGRLCVVGLEDGRILVKKVLPGRGRGLFDLYSTNAPPLLDQRVEWGAAVKAIIQKDVKVQS